MRAARARSGDAHEIYWLAALCVGLSVAAYGWILRVGFHHDDLIHLYEASNLPFSDFVAHGVGGHALALFNLSFLLSFNLFGLHPGWWMGTVLLMHALNVLLCFRLGRALSQNAPAAALGALLWGVSITGAGTLYWYSVFGQVMATALALAALIAVLAATDHEPVRHKPIVIAVAACGAAVVCFGTGLAFAIVFPVTVWLIAPALWKDGRSRLLVLLTPVLAAALYAVNLLLTEHSDTATHPAGAMRTAILPLVVSGWSSKLSALVVLLFRGTGDLLVGVFASPPLWADGAITLAVAATVVRRPPAVRRRVLGVLVAAVAIYGAIVATRGGLAADEHPLTRYQYQATTMLALVISALAGSTTRALRVWRAVTLATAAAVTVALAVRGWPDSAVGLHYQDFLDVRQRLEQVTSAAEPPVYVANRAYDQAAPILGGTRSPFFPGWAAMHCITLDQLGAPTVAMHFVEADKAILKAARAGRCTAGLFVAQPPSAAAVQTIAAGGRATVAHPTSGK